MSLEKKTDSIHEADPSSEIDFPKLEFPVLVAAFNAAQKAKTLLLLLDENAIGFEDFFDGYSVTAGFESMQQFMDVVKQELRKLGFFSKISEDLPQDKNDHLSWRITYGKHARLVSMYAQRLCEQDKGLLLGYPRTAVQAFPDSSLMPDAYPVEIKNHPLVDFLPFLLSKDHATEEWQWFLSKLIEAKQKFPVLTYEYQIAHLLP